MASNKITVELDESDRRLINRLCDNLEANQRNAESGTTACSAAGGGVEQVKTAGSAGREPGLIEDIVQWVEEQITDLRGTEGQLTPRDLGKRQAYCHVLTKLTHIIEARR